MASCSALKIFTQKAPARAMRGQLVELFAGANSTMGGSNDNAENDWHEKPTGSPSSVAVTMVIPVAKCPEHFAEPGLVEARHLHPTEVDRLALVGRRHILHCLCFREPAEPM